VGCWIQDMGVIVREVSRGRPKRGKHDRAAITT
jgi:hypothetical protein